MFEFVKQARPVIKSLKTDTKKSTGNGYNSEDMMSLPTSLMKSFKTQEAELELA